MKTPLAPIAIAWFFCLGIVRPATLVAQAEPSESEIRSAVEASLTLLESSSKTSSEKRQCFTCHHQAMPLLLFAEADRKGVNIDRENMIRQLDHTWTHLNRGKEGYAKGEGQGGGVDTAGFALWALDVGEREDDEVTAAVVEYLLRKQQDNGRWKCSSNRPPSEASDFTTTYLALYGLQNFAPESEHERVQKAYQGALEWLLNTAPIDTEDHVFRLLALHYFADFNDAAGEAAAEQSKQMIDLQREDGGWAQLESMESDAYATGQVLDALFRVGSLEPSAEAYVDGIAYLTKAQQDDGSWLVESRSKPFQTYYETGFPHEKNQFISASASCWATMALLHAMPDVDSD